MKTLRLFISGCCAIITSISIFAQSNISVFTSTGYTHHLGRNGINLELGLDYEIFKRLDITTAYRYCYMNRHDEWSYLSNKVEVSNISFYLSWIIMNKNSHRIMAGPGIFYGKYIRNNNKNPEFNKEYVSTWINPVRIQYDYTFPKNFRIGGIISLYGDDADGTTYFGVLAGYRF